MALNLLFAGDCPPEERAFREKISQGLPNPQTQGACLVILKREACESILAGAVDPLQFMTSAVVAANELPEGTDRATVCRCVFNAASLGLLFGNTLGEAYLVPYPDKEQTKKQGKDVYSCSLIVGYKGFRRLAFESGFLKSFTTEVVLTDETVDCWVDETGRRLRHNTPIGRDPKPNGENVQAVYCQYTTNTGATGVVVIGRAELDRLRPSYRSDFWARYFPAMASKTAIRKASKEWPIGGKLAAAVRIDEQLEAGVLQSLLVDAGLLDDAKFDIDRSKKKRTGKSDLHDRLRDIAEGRTAEPKPGEE